VLTRLLERLTGYADVRTVVAVGESPAVALNRVEAAVRDSRYPVERTEGRVTIGGPPLNDFLIAQATPMDVGTRVELWGHIAPEVTHRVLRELSKSRP
jgi:hypothetical protein